MNDHPLAIDVDDVRAAATRLAGVAHRTPVVTSRTIDARCGRRVFFKCENLQRVGAFKFRGAYNTLVQLDDRQRAGGVVAFSSGNHAQAVACAAQILGMQAVIVMPEDAPRSKLEATRGYGAEVVFHDRLREDRQAIAEHLAAERGATLVPPYDHPWVMAGQGTTAWELLEEVPDLDTLLMPLGGGGLLSGCAVAARARRPEIRIFGVETATSNDWWQSLRAGRRIRIDPPDTIADGIRTLQPGVLTFPVVQQLVEDVLLVSDAEVLATLRLLLLRMKLLVEPTGAVAAAALLHHGAQVPGERIGVILSGGNVDAELLARVLATHA